MAGGAAPLPTNSKLLLKVRRLNERPNERGGGGKARGELPSFIPRCFPSLFLELTLFPILVWALQQKLMERNYILPFCLVTSLFFVSSSRPPSRFIPISSCPPVLAPRLNALKPCLFLRRLIGLGIRIRSSRCSQQAFPERVSSSPSLFPQRQGSFPRADLSSFWFGSLSASESPSFNPLVFRSPISESDTSASLPLLDRSLRSSGTRR